MTFKLTKKELELVEGWYLAAAGESVTADSVDEYRELLALLKKFGFELHYDDIWECNRLGIQVK